MGVPKSCLHVKIAKSLKIVKRVGIGLLSSAQQHNRHLRLVLKTALPCVVSMDLMAAREVLVRQYHRPWKIVMGIVTTRTRACFSWVAH